MIIHVYSCVCVYCICNDYTCIRVCLCVYVMIIYVYACVCVYVYVYACVCVYT